jgi:hypothetical protein
MQLLESVCHLLESVFRIRMILDLPDPDSFVRGTDPDLPSSSKNSTKNLYFYCFVTFYNFLSLKNDVNVSSKTNKQNSFI